MLFAVLVWGASFIATKEAVATVPPIAFAVMRFTLASCSLGAVHLVTRTPIRIPRELWGRVALAGFLGTTMTYVLENVALKYTTAGNGAMFIAASPLLTIAGAILLLGERLTWRKGVGALLAFVGMVGLVGAHVAQTGFGDALMALNTVVGAWYALVSKTLADRLSPLVTLTATFVIGTLGLLPFALGEAWLTHGTYHLTPLILAALAYLGLGSSCLAYWLWMYALGKMSASSAGIYLYLMPVITLLLSTWLLGESLTPMKIVEAGVILAGVYLASSHPPEPQRQSVGAT